MRLRQLIHQIQGLEVKGSKEIEITGITAHSKSVAPGNLFVARKGKNHDGSAYIPDAVAAGASCVLTDLYDPFLPLVQLIHPDVASIAASLAARFYQNPSHALKVIGITGTNGKTTIAYLLKHLFDQMGVRAGLVGTIEWIVKDHKFPSAMTTPDVCTCQKLLREMVQGKSEAAVMEVSSHGLDQGRVEGVEFAMGIFTNLSPEHLDYHRDMQTYKEAKEKLFAGLAEDKWAIFNADEELGFRTKARTFTYGIDQPADLMAKEIKLSLKKTRAILLYEEKEYPCTIPMMGMFNVYNYLAALSAGICYGFPIESCIEALKKGIQVPGRLEKVTEGVYVDFAHTPDALKTVLTTLKHVAKGRVITVFGCGGDRDQEKRPLMGEVVTSLSEVAVITSDNPRSERPEKIVEDILAGCKGPVSIELDRAKAIQFALGQKGPDDLVLIAGKGHEKEQIFAHQVLAFEDAKIVRDICEGACAK